LPDRPPRPSGFSLQPARRERSPATGHTSRTFSCETSGVFLAEGELEYERTCRAAHGVRRPRNRELLFQGSIARSRKASSVVTSTCDCDDGHPTPIAWRTVEEPRSRESSEGERWPRRLVAGLTGDRALYLGLLLLAWGLTVPMRGLWQDDTLLLRL